MGMILDRAPTLHSSYASCGFFFHYLLKHGWLILNHHKVLLFIHLVADQPIYIIFILPPHFYRWLIFFHVVLELRIRVVFLIIFDAMWKILLADFPHHLSKVKLLIFVDLSAVFTYQGDYAVFFHMIIVYFYIFFLRNCINMLVVSADIGRQVSFHTFSPNKQLVR